MPLPLTAVLTYTALANGGLTPAQMAARMANVNLYGGVFAPNTAPPLNAAQLPAGTSDAVFDVLFGANVESDVTAIVSGAIVARTITLSLRPAEGYPTASSFVSLGNAGSAAAPTSNPPLPSPVYPFPAGSGAESAWTGSIVSSSSGDYFGALASGPGARTVEIFYLDVTGAAHSEIVELNGTTPVNLANPNKYIIHDVEVLTTGPNGAAPLGKINIWSGPVDPITGLPTGTLVGYLPNSYFTNFSFQQLGGWGAGQVAPILENQLVPPDFHYPDQTVVTPVGTAPPPPSKYLLDYPPPSSVANPNRPDYSGGVATPVTDVVGGKAVRVRALGGPPVPGPVNDPLLTLAPNFTNPNSYLSDVFYGGVPTVPNPFQGLGLGAFGRALNMPISRIPYAGTVSMTVALV